MNRRRGEVADPSAWADAARAAQSAAARHEREHGPGDPFAAMLRELAARCAARAEKPPRRFRLAE